MSRAAQPVPPSVRLILGEHRTAIENSANSVIERKYMEGDRLMSAQYVPFPGEQSSVAEEGHYAHAILLVFDGD